MGSVDGAGCRTSPPIVSVSDAPGRPRRSPMNYVIAGYTIVLIILFLYGVQLVWRRRRLTRPRRGWPRPTPGSSGAGHGPMTTGPSRRVRPAGGRSGPEVGPTPDRARRRLGPQPDAAPTVRTGHRLRYVVVGLVLVGSLVFLVVKGLSSALDFYLPADQAMAQTGHAREPDLQPRRGGRAGVGPFHAQRGGLRGHLGIDPARRGRTPAARRSSSSPTSRSSPSATSAGRSSSRTRSWSSTRRTTSPPIPAGSRLRTGPSDDRTGPTARRRVAGPHR